MMHDIAKRTGPCCCGSMTKRCACCTLGTVRVAVAERFAITATKDGYIWLRPEDDLRAVGQDIVTKKNGFANLVLWVR